MKQRDKQLRFDALRAIGCLCCRLNAQLDPPKRQTPLRCEIHHLNAGGHAGQKRLGDEATIPLCEWHHRGRLRLGFTRLQMACAYGPSLARESKAFRNYYGNDAQLLDLANTLIEKAESMGAAA